ncbi:MAG: hypothetical protein IKJ43_04465 [Bacilli bacterium]|nr:hypothetical protein [Bacilli bacterium]
MQIYLKLSILPLFLMGIILLFNGNVHYKFKISDLVLILPLIMLIMSQDGRLTMSFAGNRMTNFATSNKNSEVKEDNIEEKTPEVEKVDEKAPEVEKVDENAEIYFDIVDENYMDLANYITFAPKTDKFIGKTIKVKGFINTSEDYIPNGFYAIGKYAISCCAADAGFVGFIVKKDDTKINDKGWYEIEGILEKSKDVAGYDILTIKPTNIKQIDDNKEEQYVYPCYSYGDGSCNAVGKYNIGN